MLGILMLIVGLFALIKGGNWLVEGSVSIAKHLHVPEMVIGLTLVAFGTSTPELLVNIFAALGGKGDIALGNVLGSNIANIALILGFSLLFRDLLIRKTTTAFEIPLVILSAFLLLVLAGDKWLDGQGIVELSRSEGIVLLLFFVIFLIYNGFLAVQEGFEEKEEIKTYGLPLGILLFLGGLALLIFGGKFTVDGAVNTARLLGVPERIIALTVVAVGTSLPEMATSIIAAKKGSSDIAVGNVLGSNIFNVFFILGVSALLRPLEISSGIQRDFVVNLLVSLLCWGLVLFGRGKISKKSGVVFLGFYVFYLIQMVVFS
ncbi:MAG: calcium/sodium antiporter [Brevinematales bacterium]|nr:calcium/sodium antiporter [Brevinematales bacterium]